MAVLQKYVRLSREREDVFPVRERSHATGLDPPVYLSGAVQWTDLAALQAQLHNQRQTIESLMQNLRSVERERDSQQRQIQILQEEVRRLRERLEDQEKERERRQDIEGDAVEMRLEQWKREVGRDLSALRGHINRATSLGNREERFSSKLCREEVEQFRREVDMLKSKLMRHEEDMYQQQSEARETRKQCERNCKALETVIDSYRAHDFELSRIISQYHHTQQDVRDVRLAVSGLKDEVRSLILRDRLNTPAEMQQKSNPLEAAVAVETSPLRQMLSDSDDELSPTPSLRDVSSDDLDTSWLGESASKPRSQGRVTHFSLSGSDLSDAVSGLGSNHDDVDGKVGGASDSAPELSLCDL
ncbi:RNA-binding protein 25 isoform X2 [Neoarius graeffei]|uniref:RNA-binding protein 25 isoform X2 n=1 Tax=Neoarius graeffei TaxID=443677 RepID=UPI00298BFD9A|nr:RNA-binding protein 25 isoform X2 [Neoarius graeffei]XP_060773508.1 RNA-binding protein 25 isoform X2 [Neoarius graeffei]